MKKTAAIKTENPDLVQIVRYTALAVIVVTAIAAIFNDAEVAIPISIVLVVMAVIFGYWTRRKQ